MLIKKAQALKKENSPSCTVWEYEYPSQDFGFATALINGRYPDSGKAQNTACEELYFVLSGSGTIHTDHGKFQLETGDLYYFAKNESYWVEGQNLQLALVNAPKWTLDQYKILD